MNSSKDLSIILANSPKETMTVSSLKRNIMLVGDAASGKTSYLTALANCYHTGNDAQGRVLSVDVFGEAAELLKDYGENMLKQGVAIPRSNRNENAKFVIKLKPHHLFEPISAIMKKDIKIDFSITASTGELFESLCQKENIELISKSYATASGLMLIIDGLSKDDSKYAGVFRNLFKGMTDVRRSKSEKVIRPRIAVVITKSEQNFVSVHKRNPRELCDLRFPKAMEALNNWQRAWRCPMNFFLCSNFGFLGNTGEPNCILSDQIFTISKSNSWKPFGLIAPIYWLHNGKDDVQLR
jgi:hypothetical protein